MSYDHAEQDKKDRRRSTANKRKSELAFSDYRLVRIEFTAEEKDECRDFLDTHGTEPLPLDAYTDQRYTVKFSKDKNGGGVLCSITSTNPEDVNAGCTLTGRGRDTATAFWVAHYKDRYICGDRTWLECENDRGDRAGDIA